MTVDRPSNPEALLKRIAELEALLADSEIGMSIAVEHGDTIENELITTNQQLEQEITQKEVAQRHLQELVDAITTQNTDLEIILDTLNEHSDNMDQDMWEELLESEQRGTTDALTGLSNRRHFDEYLDQHFNSCARHKRPISLLMGDIDFFKIYNDTYGHPQGDECLKQVASAIDKTVRRDLDLAVRYGGEEFAVILPETEIAGAKTLADEIVANVEALKLVHEGSGVSDVVTISIGVHTFYPKRGDASKALIIRADQVLYQAKEQGRNQACSADIPNKKGEKTLITQVKTYGKFDEKMSRGQEYLELAFSPSSRPITERWQNNGLSADFLADYFGSFIPKEMPKMHHNQIKGAVAYIANELLENAMKFANPQENKASSLSLSLSDKNLRFTLINQVNPENCDKLVAFLEEFTSVDAGDFFVIQMERNIETGSESGLGFATMVTDHDAKVSWKLSPTPETMQLTTQVVIDI